MRVSKLHVGNFKVLRDVPLEDLRGLNIFVGPNATGKSTVLQALGLLLSEGGSITLNLNSIFGRHPGSLISMECDLGLTSQEVKWVMEYCTNAFNVPPPSEGVIAEFDKLLRQGISLRGVGAAPRQMNFDTPFSFSKKVLAQGKPLGEYLPSQLSAEGRSFLGRYGLSNDLMENGVRSLAGLQSFYIDVSRRLLPRFGVGTGAKLSPNEVGQWIHQARGEKRPEFDEYEKLIARHLPHAKGILFRHTGGNIQLGMTEEGFTDMTPAEGWSTGTSHLGLLLGTFVSIPMGSVVIIEEPELSLHPAAIRNLMEEIHALVDNGSAQFFITSHSPVVIEDLDPKLKDHDLWRFNRNPDGSTSALKCKSEKEIEEAHLSLSARK